ncbi:MAG TPA: DUF1566 domain-containing protein [Gammaproteobacteria bacterium]|nr:DUF1566 domain-containing protein [Gammaproteobacteria bacterium]
MQARIHYLAVLFMLLAIPASGHAALLPRLQGLAVYDTVLDLTWLSRASISDALLSWDDAMAQVNGLEVAGIGGWRLPRTPQPDSSCSIHNASGLSMGLGCTGSEMGSLFSRLTPADGVLFTDLDENRPYWSGTLLDNDPAEAWRFDFGDGWQETDLRLGGRYRAWAVHDGDIASLVPVPLPPSGVLALAGLAGLLACSQRRQSGRAQPPV